MLEVFSVILIIYVVVGTVIAITSRRYGVKSTSDYFVGSYRLGAFLSAMTYAATTYSAFMMVGLVGLTYATGVGALGFELAYLVSTVALLTIFSRRVWGMARERRWVSPSEMLSDLYNSKLLGSLVAITYFIALIPYTSAQIIGIGTLLESLGLNYVLGIIVATSLVLIWTVIAGLWSVATTDAYQGILMISASIMFLWLTLTKLPTTDLNIVINTLDNVGVTGLTPFWSFNTFLAYTLPWVFFAVTNPQVVQRIYMPANEKALKKMITYFSIYGFLYTIIVVIIGLLARVLTEFKVIPFISYRDYVTPTLILTLDPIPASIIIISIIAAAVSTANSIILSVTSSIIRDFYESRLRVSSREVLVVSNAVVIMLTLITALIAYLRPGFIVEMSVLSSVILLPLAPITIISWLGVKDLKSLRYGAITALICGASIAIYNALIYGPVRAFLTTVLGIPISLWVLITSTSILVMNYVIVTHRRRPQITLRSK